ncbi:MAG: YihY/virulence factor BrkB family protein [Cyclobacteriaceae bacterium]|nr:YihY/virulence factor BrkB family protein [Cyclobacteriaceae bacterium]
MNFKIRKIILRFPSLMLVRSWMKSVKFKRHHNISLYRFIKVFIANIQKDDLVNRANGVAYNFILAIFPAIIFLFTLTPYVAQYFPQVNRNSIMEFMGEMMPPSMYEVVSSTILDIINNQRGGLLTFGFIFALYLSTNGMMALMRAFNACYQTVERRSAIRMRITATGLTFMLAIVLIMAVALLIIGQLVIDYVAENLTEFSNLNFDQYTIYMFLGLRFLVIFIVFFVAISFIYYFGPAVHYNWSFFSIGSFLATLGSLGISYGFSYYITNFGTYNKVYGSIGVLIALMIWVQLITIVLLFGYEINASLHHGIKLEAIELHKRQMRMSQVSRE